MSKTFKYTIVLWFLFINVSFANVIDVDNTQLKKLIKEDVSIVDIRTINEWNHTGVIPNSLLITFFDEKGNYDLDQWHEKLLENSSYNKDLIIICRSGRRSKIAAEIISKKFGINVYNAKYGIKSWIQSNQAISKP
jgi:rhodanese-related sulfurtransferase